MKILSNFLIIYLFFSCTSNVGVDLKIEKQIAVKCTKEDDPKSYNVGDLPCLKYSLISGHDELKISYKKLNQRSEDPYERGYQELLRIRDNKNVERLRLRKNDDANWLITPFVRLRKEKYIADIDGDGFKEFAIFPFHPGSAIWGTVRIYSLKEKIELWGEGRYQFEGDTFVQLGCMECSKFNPDKCRTCY